MLVGKTRIKHSEEKKVGASMIFIIYVSVAVVCISAADGSGDKKNDMGVMHIKGGEEMSKGVAGVVGLAYKDSGDLWTRQQVSSEQSMYHMSARGDETFDDEKEQAYLNDFLDLIKYSPVFKNCKTGTFGCTYLSSRVLAYLKHLGQTNVRNLGTASTDPAYSATLTTYGGATKHLCQDPKQFSAYAVMFNDPNWRKQWYVQDYRTTDYPVMDHNVVPLYFQDLTGLTVIVGVLGDGVQAHPDLGDNYVESISYNFCSEQRGSTPGRKYGAHYTYETEGTSSAGVIAMKANNELCGVGIAHKARIAGLRMTKCDSSVSNIEARALKYNLDVIDIYCNTWTINDEMGNKLVELSDAVESALKLGISEGRNKKGAIYVFPSGSNRRYNNCAANGFVNNPYVIAIASAASDGVYALYSEPCPAVFATAYSGDTYIKNENITTISAEGGCGNYPMDRPAGPALATGIFALVLEYKPSLTYRDMMHLIAMTAEVAPLANNKYSWYKNGRGLWVSNDFGFGLLNAKNMINLAKDWTTVPHKRICVLNKDFKEPLYFTDHTSQTITLDGFECSVGDKKINYLEHVELISTFEYTFRGVVYLNVTSPAKTKTQMLKPRLKDYHADITRDWNIMSVHNWGENPQGSWDVTVMACQIKGRKKPHGYIHKLALKLHGTEEMPAHYKQERIYAAFRLPEGSTSLFS